MVGGCLGEVMDVETDGVQWDTSARVRVLLDVTEPLRRVQRISVNFGSGRIQVQKAPYFLLWLWSNWTY